MANTVESGRSTTLNQKVNSGDANTTLQLASVPWTVTTGVVLIDTGNNKEWASFTGVSGDQLTGVTMGFDQDATSMSDSTAANKKNHVVGTIVRLVNHSLDINNKAILDGANTFTGTQTFNGTIQLTDSTVTIRKDGNDMKLKDPNNSEKTLSELAASGSDEKVSVSNNDTTPDFLINKLTADSESITLTENNDGGDENIEVGVKIDPDGGLEKGANGIGVSGVTLTAGENVTAGDALRMKIDGTVYKADEDLEIGDIQRLFTETDRIASVQIDTDKIAYIYYEAGDAWVKSRVVTWDGERYTLGTEENISQTDSEGFLDITKVDTDKFAAVYYDNNPANADTMVVVCTVSGTTITVGTPQIWESGVQTSSSRHAITSSDTDVVTVTWEDDGSSDTAKSKTATISGTVMTIGSEVTVSSDTGSGDALDVTEIGAGKIVNVYRNASDDLAARVATISGTTMTQGSEVVLDSSITVDLELQVAKVQDDKFIVVYKDSAATIDYMVVCTVSGTTITGGIPVVTNTDVNINRNTSHVLYFADNKVAFVYFPENIIQDSAKLNYMASWVTTSGTVPTIHDIKPLSQETEAKNELYTTNNPKALTLINADMFQFGAVSTTTEDFYTINVADNNFIGFADSTETSGNPVVVNLAEDNNQSSLSTGSKYWLSDSGAISTQGRVFAGTAVSATKIIRN